MGIATDEVPDDGSPIALAPPPLGWPSPNPVDGSGRPPQRALLPRDIPSLFDVPAPDSDLLSIRDDLNDYIAERPATSELLGVTLGLKDPVFEQCDQELAGEGDVFDASADVETMPPTASRCGIAFLGLYMAYAQSGDVAMADMLARFIAGTAPRLPPASRDSYLRFLRSIPTWAEERYQPLFGPAER